MPYIINYARHFYVLYKNQSNFTYKIETKVRYLLPVAIYGNITLYASLITIILYRYIYNRIIESDMKNVCTLIYTNYKLNFMWKIFFLFNSVKIWYGLDRKGSNSLHKKYTHLLAQCQWRLVCIFRGLKIILLVVSLLF